MKKLIPIVLVISLSACGGGGGGNPTTSPVPPVEPPVIPPPPPDPTDNPDYHLETDRFTTHQPKVLEQVGAHHAYAKKLTGKGVRIGIEDTIVDYTQTAEFGSRVKLKDADGAVLSYPRPLGAQTGDIAVCQISANCNIQTINSEGDSEAVNDRVQKIVSEDGWPVKDDSVFIVDEYYSEDNALEAQLRWKEVPTPYGSVGFHGTAVTSVAAGKNLGVAPEATIIPVALNLTDDQDDFDLSIGIREIANALTVENRKIFDEDLATNVRNEYAKFDIINGSYGSTSFDTDEISGEINALKQWYTQNLPRYWDAFLQKDTPDADKTIFVFAAGNEKESRPNIEADLPYHIPELRGHSLAVVATDLEGIIAKDYSNQCGTLPTDWNPALHGPHYCLAAPGTVRGLVPNSDTPGQGDIGTVEGTSFATPIVSGSLALMMEHFRGTRGNTEIVKRMLDTADRTGIYASIEIYGAGLLDLEAALAPVGALTVGQKLQSLSHSTLQTPAAFGSITDRLSGLELAAFDEQNFPFWFPLTTVVSTRETVRSHIPVLRGASVGISVTAPDIYGLSWVPTANVKSLWLNDEGGWIFGFGPSSASLAKSPHNGVWGYGFNLENSGYMGAETSGAFGSSVDSGMVWSSRTFQHRFSGGWKLDAVGTLALSMPQYDKNAIFQASSSILSSASMRVGTESTGLVIEQPLRAETGTGIFRIENGLIENGERLYDEHRVSLSPDRRETRVTFRHDRKISGGQLAFQVSSAINAGHVSGKRESSVGLAYQINR